MHYIIKDENTAFGKADILISSDGTVKFSFDRAAPGKCNRVEFCGSIAISLEKKVEWSMTNIRRSDWIKTGKPDLSTVANRKIREWCINNASQYATDENRKRALILTLRSEKEQSELALERAARELENAKTKVVDATVALNIALGQ